MAKELTFKLNVETGQSIQSVDQLFNAIEAGARKAQGQMQNSIGKPISKEIELKLKNGKVVTQEITNAEKAQNRLHRATAAVNGQFGRTPNKIRQSITVLKQLRGDTEKYNAVTGKVNKQWTMLTQRIRAAEKAQKKMTGGGMFSGFNASLFKSVTAANLATQAIQMMGQAVTGFIQGAFEMETLTLQLEAFTGSAEGADAAFREFIEIAAKTPFDLKQVAQAGKIMMAFGMDTETAIKATDQLGIVAAATNGDLNLMARNLGQISAQGQAYTRDLTQFAIQGVPIWEQLSIVTGESVSSLKEMAREGKIGFKEVSDALSNLTAEGSQFKEVADRMQETFQGRLQRINGAVQMLQKEFIDTFNAIDSGFGEVVANSMKLFADGLMFIAENFRLITDIVIAATAATAAYFLVQNWGTIISGVQKFIQLARTNLTWTKLQLAAETALAALRGNWPAIAAAVAAGAGAYLWVSQMTDKATDSQAELNTEAGKVSVALGEVSARDQELAAGRGGIGMVTAYREARGEANGLKKEMDAQMEILQGMKAEIKERYKVEITKAKEVARDIQDNLRQQADEYRQLTTDVKRRYDMELDQQRQILENMRTKHSEEIANLQARTPEEQKLLDFERKKIEKKLAGNKLDEEERLRLEARLSRMKQNEKIDEARLEHKKKEKVVEDKITQLQKDRKSDLDELKRKHEENTRQLKQDLQEQKDAIKALEEQRDSELTKIKEAEKAVEGVVTENKKATQAVVDQANQVINLANQYWNAEKAARAAAAAIRQANREAANSKNSGGNGRASGGPVSGGSTYTVNELGKEAFLSASGKLSMINAPAWGQWRAPSSGTVIPAHLTSQLNIPTGGVNINKGAAAQTSRAGAGGGGVASAIRAIKNSMGNGDRITNNVTIQSANTTQAASDMLVKMTALRRRRYS